MGSREIKAPALMKTFVKEKEWGAGVREQYKGVGGGGRGPL